MCPRQAAENIDLRKRVRFHLANKHELTASSDSLYQAAKLIVDPKSTEETHTLALKIRQHRGWIMSIYSWLAERVGWKRSPTTYEEILSLLVSMPKYQNLLAGDKAESKSNTAKKNRNFTEEEKLHTFQENVCLAYLKKRGTVWFFNGDKANCHCRPSAFI